MVWYCMVWLVWRGVAWRGVAWRGVAWRGVAWYGMVFIYSTSLYILHRQHIIIIYTQDAEREMHEVQYLYVAFP